MQEIVEMSQYLLLAGILTMVMAICLWVLSAKPMFYGPARCCWCGRHYEMSKSKAKIPNMFCNENCQWAYTRWPLGGLGD